MNVEKKEQQNFEKTYYCGVGAIKVLMFSPNRQQLNRLLNYEPDKEQEELEYVKDDVEVKGADDSSTFHKQVNVDVWVEDLKFKEKFKIRFTITDKVRTSKDGSKTQYVNQLGQTSWVDDVSNLTEFFSKFKLTDKNDKSNVTYIDKEYKEALMGEEQLYNFLAKWLNFSSFEPKNNIFLDRKKLFKGDFSELNSLVGDFEDNSVGACFAVKTKTEDEGDKKYQVVSNKFFLPGIYMKGFRNFARNNFAGIESDKGYDLKKFYKDINDAEHGIKDFFINQEISVYDENQDALATTTSSVISSDSSDY